MRRLVIGLMVCAALASCGGGEELAVRASKDLSGRVSAIQEAVEAGDAALAGLLLERMQGAVDRWVAQGLLTEERATTIRSAAEDVVAELGLLSAEVAPSESPSPTPTVDPGDDDEDDEDHDNSGPGNGDDEDHDNSGPGNGDDFEDD